LEFASQGDLLTYVQRVGAIPEQKRTLWSYQLCDAVKYLHELEVVHRDLKLENLLLDINGNKNKTKKLMKIIFLYLDNMKLCDFGFSKDVLKCKEYLSKTYCGSRAYVSPEILLGLPYDAKKADIWAIGVIIYIFVTGVVSDLI
jgi:serine kinase